jgi:hypothetical protein
MANATGINNKKKGNPASIIEITIGFRASLP